MAVKDAVHKLQLYLFEGIQDENKLFAAGVLMSQSDYQDVLTERSIANLCGYPLCGNALPSERPRKGRYRISLKEHKVYDLEETYKYCSTTCVVNSRAFAGILQEERSSDLNPAKLNEVLRLFTGLSLEDSKEGFRKDGKLGLSELKVQEKTEFKGAEVSLEEWTGPSNAIEGYVPQRDNNSRPEQVKKPEKGQKPKRHQLNKEKNIVFDEMDFMSTIITQDEYTVSKALAPVERSKEPKGKVNGKVIKYEPKLEKPVASKGSHVQKKSPDSGVPPTRKFMNEKFDLSREMNEKLSISDPSGHGQNIFNDKPTETDSEHPDKASASNCIVLKSSLKSSTAKKVTHSVTWADEKTDGKSSKILCEFKESEDETDTSKRSGSAEMDVDDDSYRFTSAEVCARALSEAAEAVTSGDSDVSDAVAEAGIIILPPPENADEAETFEEADVPDPERAPLKWPSKPGLPDSNMLDSDDSWYDSPPEGFNLTLSPFATMFMALFAWTSSSSLAYIYGHDESLHEEYLYINGREYPRKIVSTDGHSSEIRQALSGCLARALAGLIADLRLPMPLSTLEKELDRLLDTMSFSDPLPPFRMKQWQLVVLLLLDALSVSRIPALTPYMTGRRILLPKVLEGAVISAEEYEIMKDLLIPLGRVPQFTMQSGG